MVRSTLIRLFAVAAVLAATACAPVFADNDYAGSHPVHFGTTDNATLAQATHH